MKPKRTAMPILTRHELKYDGIANGAELYSLHAWGWRADARDGEDQREFVMRFRVAPRSEPGKPLWAEIALPGIYLRHGLTPPANVSTELLLARLRAAKTT